MNWFYLSLSSILALSTAELTSAHLLKLDKTFSERTNVAYIMIIQGLLALGAYFLLGYSIKELFVIDKWSLFLIIANAVIGVFSVYFYFKSFKVKNLSYSIIFLTLSVVVSTTIGIIFYNESTTIYKFLGLLGPGQAYESEPRIDHGLDAICFVPEGSVYATVAYKR